MVPWMLPLNCAQQNALVSAKLAMIPEAKRSVRSHILDSPLNATAFAMTPDFPVTLYTWSVAAGGD
jgi:hypothetical protein